MGIETLYHKVPSTDDVDCQDLNEAAASTLPSTRYRNFQNPKLLAFIFPAFLFSILLNLIGAGFFLRARHSSSTPERSKFAGLERNVTKAWKYHGLYDSKNETLADQAWNEISIDAGNIALEDSYVDAMGLPKAQRFPWDDTKGIYYIHAYHSLHCLKKIRQSYVEYQRGVPQSGELEHIAHCFQALLEDIRCHADDTPRYSGFQPSLSTGLGQKYQCRDWHQLEEWAKSNNACWRYTDHKRPGYHVVEDFTFCPKDSPYASKVAEVFGSNFHG